MAGTGGRHKASRRLAGRRQYQDRNTLHPRPKCVNLRHAPERWAAPQHSRRPPARGRGTNAGRIIWLLAGRRAQWAGAFGEVSELADEHDLGSCAERRGSSSLPFPTRLGKFQSFGIEVPSGTTASLTGCDGVSIGYWRSGWTRLVPTSHEHSIARLADKQTDRSVSLSDQQKRRNLGR